MRAATAATEALKAALALRTPAQRHGYRKALRADPKLQEAAYMNESGWGVQVETFRSVSDDALSLSLQLRRGG